MSERPRLRLPLPGAAPTPSPPGAAQGRPAAGTSSEASPGAGNRFDAPRGAPELVDSRAESVSRAGGAVPTARRRLDIIAPEPSGYPTAGPLTLLALGLVVAVGAVFVRGSRDALEDGVDPAPRAAGERPMPDRPRTWQDAYRAQHPELLVGSPKLPYLVPRARRAHEARPEGRNRPRADALMWRAERLEAVPLPSELGLDPSTHTPHYDGKSPEPDQEVPARVIVRSIPPRARVEVNGQVLGMTPWIRRRPEGMADASVKISLPGYLPEQGRLSERGNDLLLEVRLRPDPSADPALRGE